MDTSMNNTHPETVKIKHSDDHGNDHLIINKSDFDPNKHELFEGETAEFVNNGTDDGREAARRLQLKHNVEAERGVTRGTPKLA
jgi:hypothetical protein